MAVLIYGGEWVTPVEQDAVRTCPKIPGQQGTITGMDLSCLNPDSEPVKSLSSGLDRFLAFVSFLTVVVGPLLRRFTLNHVLARLDALEKVARSYGIAFSGDTTLLPPEPAESRAVGLTQRGKDQLESKFAGPVDAWFEKRLGRFRLGDKEYAVLADKYHSAASNAYLLAVVGLPSIIGIGVVASLIPAGIMARSLDFWPTVVACIIFVVSFLALLIRRIKILRKRAQRIPTQQVQRFKDAAYPAGQDATPGGQSATAPEKDTVVQPKKESGPQDGDQDEETPPPPAPVAQPKGFCGAALALIIGLLLLRRLR